MLFKNAAQKIHVFAYDATTGAPKTGDAGNITAYVSLDGTSQAVDDVSAHPSEVSAANMPGVYAFSLSAGETNCDSFALYAKSSTANVCIEPIVGFTQAGAIPKVAAGAPNGLPLMPASGALEVDLQTIKGQSITCSAAVTVGAYVGNATHAVAVDAGGYVTFNNTSIAAVTAVTNGVTLAADQAVNVTKWGGVAIAGAYVQANAAQWGGGSLPTVSTANQIADAVLARNVSNVEAAAPRTSLATLVLATTNKANTKAHAGQFTVYRTDGATEHAQIAISTDPNAAPIDGIGG
jgi:hypothetical protein